MSLDKEIQDAFQQLKGGSSENNIFPATVKSVDKEKGTCEVNDGDLDYTDVRLSAVIDSNDNKLYIFPVVGSSVLVSMIDGLENLFVNKCSDVEEFYLKTKTAELHVSAAGFKIDREGENLKKVLNDYIDEVNKIIVVQGTSINVAATTVIKQRLNKILI